MDRRCQTSLSSSPTFHSSVNLHQPRHVDPHAIPIPIVVIFALTMNLPNINPLINHPMLRPVVVQGWEEEGLPELLLSGPHLIVAGSLFRMRRRLPAQTTFSYWQAARPWG